MKDQSIFSLVIVLLILITLSLDNVWILLEENCYWSLLAIEGLRDIEEACEYSHLSWLLGTSGRSEMSRFSPSKFHTDDRHRFVLNLVNKL